MSEYPVCAAYSPECGGRLEWHHAVLQQRIRRAFKWGAVRFAESGAWTPAPRWAPVEMSGPYDRTLDDILGDTRNRVFLCDTHHERLHNGRFRLELPASVWEFAAEFGFTAQLENDLARAA